MAAESGFPAAPRKTLSLFDACALIVGIMLGAGVFRAPAIVATQVGSEASFMLLWLAGGLISLAGALCYAELASRYPHAGGEYHFLQRAYGDRLAFLFAWSRMSVVQTGAIAALAFVFADYASRLAPLGTHGTTLYAGSIVIVITALNAIGSGELVVATPDGEPVRIKYERHEEQPDGNWTWIGRNADGTKPSNARPTFAPLSARRNRAG